MKKKIILISMLCIVVTLLCSCSYLSYDEAVDGNDKPVLGNYFTVIKEWACENEYYYTVYANDTHVMYLFIDGYRSYAITPLYNADGTLKIYERD